MYSVSIALSQGYLLMKSSSQKVCQLKSCILTEIVDLVSQPMPDWSMFVIFFNKMQASDVIRH